MFHVTGHLAWKLNSFMWHRNRKKADDGRFPFRAINASNQNRAHAAE